MPLLMSVPFDWVMVKGGQVGNPITYMKVKLKLSQRFGGSWVEVYRRFVESVLPCCCVQLPQVNRPRDLLALRVLRMVSLGPKV